MDTADQRFGSGGAERRRSLFERFKQWQGPPAIVFQETRTLEAHLPDAERIRELARHAQADSIVFQSAAVAALQMLDRALYSERQVAAAAISLAQREKLQEMIASLEATAEALREALSAQGAKMLDLSVQHPPASSEERSWWFALTDAMHVLEEGAEWISSLVSGQPKGGAARILSSIIARLLHRHYNKLLAEAEQWIG